MNDLNWGRKRTCKCVDYDAIPQTKFNKALLLGIAVSLLYVLTIRDDPPEYTAVFSPVGATENHTENESATADPFGYFKGKWNLWEYLGDAFASMLD